MHEVTPMPWERQEQIPALMVNMPEADYNATRPEFISAHSLAQFAAGPNVYKAYLDGALVDQDRPAYAFGRAAHCMILEGEGAFFHRYTVDDGPINVSTGRPYGRDTNKFQGWLDEVKQSGKEPVTTAEYVSMVSMTRSIVSHDDAWPLLGGIGVDGIERTIVANLRGMRLRGRPDALDLKQGILVDLKTTSDIAGFEYDFKRYAYARQLAFYRRLVQYLQPGIVLDVYVIAVEKSGLYQCGLWEVSKTTLEVADRETDVLLLELADCLERNHWPSRYASRRIL